jgi:AcrR family transcriptional regulator
MPATVLTDRPATAGTEATSLEHRVIDAVLTCVGQWGVAKTTADDVARAAGVSRATLYRAFPGGKDVLFEAAVRRELGRFFDTVSGRLDAADTLEDLVVEGTTAAAAFLRGHGPLGYLLRHEPHLVLPAFAFHRLEPALVVATAFAAPHLRRFSTDDDAAAADAEWLVRIVLSYAINSTAQLDLADPASVRRFARTYVLPGLAAHRSITS